MEIASNSIELFQNISQFYFRDFNFDFHNDFNCEKLMIQDNILSLIFTNIESRYNVSLLFQNTTLTYCEFDFTDKIESLTIDNLYRGKIEINDTLIEFENDRSYFYLEFCEGLKIEFWCKSISINHDKIK